MAEEVKADVTATETKGADAAVDYKALVEQIEQIKRAQAGSDKAYQEAARKAKELEAENEKLKTEKMTESERAKFELEKQRAEIEAKSREVADATLRLAKIKLMTEKGLDIEYADYIGGTNDNEIAANIDTFNKRLDKLVTARVEAKLLGQSKPKAAADKAESPTFTSLQDAERLIREGKL